MTQSIVERIGAAYQRDTANPRPPDFRAGLLPLSYEDITIEWLTDVLCQNTPSAHVTACRLGPPDPGTSNRRIIELDYNKAGNQAELPRRLFCKATHDLMNRIVLGVAGGARGEVRFYNLIRPHLTIEAPRAWFSHFDEETFNSIVMLEDLSDRVSEFCTHTTAMSLERARSQLELLAAYHGPCYRDARLRSAMEVFPTWPEFFGSTLDMGMKEGSNQGFLSAESVIPTRLFRRYEDIWPTTLASVRRHDELPKTFAHGDVHLKNWYVTASGEMGLADWQCAGGAHWSRDFAYAISTALKIEDRRLWERDLLQFYLDRLHAAGGPAVSFDEGWLCYRQQLLTALTWWTITLTPAPGMPEMQPRATTLEFIHRIATAMDDVDSLDSFDAL